MSEDKFNIDFKSNTSTEDQNLLKDIKEEVKNLCSNFPVYSQ